MDHSVKRLVKTLNRMDMKELVARKKLNEKQQLQLDWAREFGSKKAGKVRLKFVSLGKGCRLPHTLYFYLKYRCNVTAITAGQNCLPRPEFLGKSQEK